MQVKTRLADAAAPGSQAGSEATIALAPPPPTQSLGRLDVWGCRATDQLPIVLRVLNARNHQERQFTWPLVGPNTTSSTGNFRPAGGQQLSSQQFRSKCNDALRFHGERLRIVVHDTRPLDTVHFVACFGAEKQVKNVDK